MSCDLIWSPSIFDGTEVYSRPDKLDHVATVLYEIDMLRCTAGPLLEGKFKEARDAWVA
jgi:hypothetical protein